MKPDDDDSRRLLECLRKAGHEAIARKRRLGQYAVIWRDGAPAFIGPNPPVALQSHEQKSPANARRAGAGECGARRTH